MLRDKEKHNIKRSQTNHAGEIDHGWLDCSAQSKHSGFPDRHSPGGVFYVGLVLSIRVNSLLHWDTQRVSKGFQNNSTAAFRQFWDVPFSSPLTVANMLNVLIEKVIFGNILGIDRTLDNKFSPHCSSINYFNQIYEVLFGFETSHKLSVIWRPK